MQYLAKAIAVTKALKHVFEVNFAVYSVNLQYCHMTVEGTLQELCRGFG
jgi:hypothetical protein